MAKPTTVDGYLAALPDDARGTLERVRSAMLSAADGVEKLGYGMPGVYVDGRPVGYYAAFKDHCSYSTGSPDVLTALAKDLERYDVTKGTIRYPIGKPLPAALVRKLVKAKIAENEARPRRR